MLETRASDIRLRLDKLELPTVLLLVVAVHDRMNAARHLTRHRAGPDHFCCRKKEEDRAHLACECRAASVVRWRLD